jgi:hypothetical protein
VVMKRNDKAIHEAFCAIAELNGVERGAADLGGREEARLVPELVRHMVGRELHARSIAAGEGTRRHADLARVRLCTRTAGCRGREAYVRWMPATAPHGTREGAYEGCRTQASVGDFQQVVDHQTQPPRRVHAALSGFAGLCLRDAQRLRIEVQASE